MILRATRYFGRVIAPSKYAIAKLKYTKGAVLLFVIIKFNAAKHFSEQPGLPVLDVRTCLNLGNSVLHEKSFQNHKPASLRTRRRGGLVQLHHRSWHSLKVPAQ